MPEMAGLSSSWGSNLTSSRLIAVIGQTFSSRLTRVRMLEILLWKEGGSQPFFLFRLFFQRGFLYRVFRLRLLLRIARLSSRAALIFSPLCSNSAAKTTWPLVS